MAQFIPMVRAGATMPLLRWAEEAGHPVDTLLRQVDLGCVADGRADRPVPLLWALRFFRLMAEREGPDVPARAVSARSLADLGPLGASLMSTATPGEALDRVARVLPRHSTHEHLTVQQDGLMARVTVVWSLKLDDIALHLTQQFAAALIQEICLAAGSDGPPISRVSIRPHPVAGLDHLRPRFGAALEPARQPVLEIDIPLTVLARRFASNSTAPPADPPDWDTLKGDGSCAGSVRRVVDLMLDDPPVSIDRLCAAAGAGRRSIQRALAAEGTSFRRILDDARRARVLTAVRGRDGAATGASALGYSSAASLSHAVRRWTGAAPRSLQHRMARRQP